MQDVGFSQQTQPQKHLLSICSDSFEIDTHIPPKLFEDFPKIDAAKISKSSTDAVIQELYLRFSNTMQR